MNAEMEMNRPCSVIRICSVECSSKLSYGPVLQVFALTFKRLLQALLSVLLHCTVDYYADNNRAKIKMLLIS